MRSIFWRGVAAAFALVSCVANASADVRLPSIFGDNMVLQADLPLPFWGTAEPAEEVTVKLGTESRSTKTGADGKWQVRLPALKATATPVPLSISGKNTINLANVVVGEVWLCSGQSNMEWTVGRSANAQEEIAAADHPLIRHIKVPHTPAQTPQSDVPASGWQPATPQTAREFTAVGYYFARNLQKELNVPIGLIGSNWGGTRIEPWTPPEGFKQVPALKEIADNLDQFPKKLDNGQINHQSALALYNGMIHPLVPFAIRGALWYQGESNNGEGMQYFEKMKALIHGWRTVWNQGDFPFLYVQLASYTYPRASDTSLPEIWEAQTAALAIPNTGMAVTTDIVADLKDIHPINKQDVGKRLSLLALVRAYNRKDVPSSGPLYQSMTVEGNKVRLIFNTGMLKPGGLVSRDGKPLTWFSVAGEGKEFHKADATIDGATVVVSSPNVAKPVAVRFGWNKIAEPNLCNEAGLPASPFRTDRWTDAKNAAP
jgi:sialate O-acetylesterase